MAINRKKSDAVGSLGDWDQVGMLCAECNWGCGRAEPGDTGYRRSRLMNQGDTLVGQNANGHLLLQMLSLHIL